MQRLQAAPGNAYHFAKLAHYASAVTEQGLEDEAYFAPLADMEALNPNPNPNPNPKPNPNPNLTYSLTLTLPLTLSPTLNPNPNPHPTPIPHQAFQRQLHADVALSKAAREGLMVYGMSEGGKRRSARNSPT